MRQENTARERLPDQAACLQRRYAAGRYDTGSKRGISAVFAL